MKTVEYNGVKLQLVKDDPNKSGCEKCYFLNECPKIIYPEIDCLQDSTDEHWEVLTNDKE